MNHLPSLAITIITSVVHAVMMRVAYFFQDTYADYGAELPWLTQQFLPGSWTFYILPAICIAGYVARYLRPTPLRTVFVVCGAGTAAMVPVFIIAMYLPVIYLGSVVTGSSP